MIKKKGIFQQQAIDLWFEKFDNEIDKVLQAIGQPRAFLDKLLYDDEIYSNYQTRIESLDALPWRVECDDDNLKEFVEDNIKAIYQELKAGTDKAALFGFSVNELAYKRPMGIGQPISFDSALYKQPDWFYVRKNGELRYLPQDGHAGEEGLETEPWRYVFVRHNPTYENPKGDSLLSRCYAAYYFKRNFNEFWAIFLEKYAIPMLIGKTEGGKHDDGTDKSDVMAAALDELNQGGIGVFDINDDISVPEPRSNGEAFLNAVKASNRRIQKVMAGQVDNSDSDSGGSYASEKVSYDIKKQKIQSDAGRRMGAFNQAITALITVNNAYGLNFGDVNAKFIIDTEDKLQSDKATRDESLTKSGAKFSNDYFMREYNLQDGDLLEAEAVQNVELNALAIGDTNQDRIDDFIAQAVNESDQPINPSTIRGALARSETQEEFIAELNKLLPKKSGNFEQTMARLQFLASAEGYSAATLEAEEIDNVEI